MAQFYSFQNESVLHVGRRSGVTAREGGAVPTQPLPTGAPQVLNTFADHLFHNQYALNAARKAQGLAPGPHSCSGALGLGREGERQAEGGVAGRTKSRQAS